MIAYMSEASDKGDWFRPSLNPVSYEVFSAIKDNTDTQLLFTMRVNGAVIEAWRVGDTHDTIGVRKDPNRDENIHRTAFFGEMCMDVRYWLLQAEINNADVEITYIHPDTVELITVSSPPEWEATIRDLLDTYSRD